MANKNDILAQLLEFLSKWGAWISYVIVGLIGKFGLDILNKKKISFWYVFGTTCTACFIGYLSSEWCLAYCPAKGAIIVPVTTLASRDIMVLIKAIDWKALLQILFKVQIKK